MHNKRWLCITGSLGHGVCNGCDPVSAMARGHWLNPTRPTHQYGCNHNVQAVML